MTESSLNKGMLAMVPLCMMHAARKPQLATKIAIYTFLNLRDISEIEFKSNVCKAEKVICQ